MKTLILTLFLVGCGGSDEPITPEDTKVPPPSLTYPDCKTQVPSCL